MLLHPLVHRVQRVVDCLGCVRHRRSGRQPNRGLEVCAGRAGRDIALTLRTQLVQADQIDRHHRHVQFGCEDGRIFGMLSQAGARCCMVHIFHCIGLLMEYR